MPVPFKPVLAPLLAIVGLLVAAILTLKSSRDLQREVNIQRLDAYLIVVESLIKRWQGAHLGNVQGLSQLSLVERWAAEQLRRPLGEAYREGDYQQLRQLYLQQGYQGHALFDASLQLRDDSNYGVRQSIRIPQEALDVLSEAAREGQAISRPFPSPLPLLYGNQPQGTPMYLVCGQLSGEAREGILCLHFPQSQGIANLLDTLSNTGTSHVYAVEKSGKAFGEYASVTDFGLDDMFEGYREELVVPGDRVIGRMLRWSEELQLGLVVETPMEDLYVAYFNNRRLALGLTLIAIMLIMALSWMAQRNRHRLASREAFYHQVLDQLPTQVRIRNLQGQMIMENNLARTAPPYTLSDLPLEDDNAALTPVNRAAWKLMRELLNGCTQASRKLLQGEYPASDFRAWQLVGFPIFGRRGQLKALGSLVIDETLPVRSERALRQLTSSLEHQVAERTAELALARDAAEAAAQAKADFLANMSHEIRSPLNAVVGLIHLAERNELEPGTRNYLRRILKSAQHLQELLNSVLDFSKLEAGKLQLEQVAFKPAHLLESVTDMLWEKAQNKRLELICDLDPRLPEELYGDPLRISQILLNFADNAIKFTAVGMVVVRIRLEEQHDDCWQVCFEVQDSGIGIPQERLQDIFQPFEQLDSSTSRHFGGTGLGLAISAQLARLMGGQLHVRSEPRLGSLFALTLELQTRPEATALSAPQPRALVVDGQAESREALSTRLKGLGLQVDEVASSCPASEHLKQAKAAGKPYELMILDWDLPGMNPLELLGWAEAEQVLEATLVVLVCPNDIRQQLTDQQLGQFAAVLEKPVSAERLSHLLQNRQAGEAHVSLHGRHVLLAENERINQEVACELLQALGVRVSLAVNGYEVLSCLEADSSIELILMDVQMPGLDGLQATQRLRQSHPNLPVIAITANSLSGDRERCLAVGMNDYLSKPINPNDLEKALRCWLNVARLTVPQAVAAKPKPAPVSTLNREEALQRLLGNQRLYESLLQRFVNDYSNAVELLQEVLQQGDEAAAVELCHRFKSVASTVGADRLAALLEGLEKELRNGRLLNHNTDGIAGELARVINEVKVQASV